MSREHLIQLQHAHAFNPAPSRNDLSDVHVPFDDLSGTRRCEAALDGALRRGQRVALVGASGSGKSSVTQYVLGPTVEGLAPLPILLAVENPLIATDPTEFAKHLIALIRRWVADSSPQQTGKLNAIAPAGRGRGKRITVAPEWMGAKVELGFELGQAAAVTPVTSAGLIEQARQLLDLITADDLTPVLVLDDTDRWLAASWQEDSTKLRSAFFGRITRVIAEELAAAAVIAVHHTYLPDPDYQSAGGFIGTTMLIPTLGSADAVSAILGRRASVALDIEEVDVMSGLIRPDAVALIFEHYRHSPDIRRRVLQVAHAALTIAVDSSAHTLAQTHIRAALTENFAPE